MGGSYRGALDQAASLEAIGRVVKTAARQLTGARGATFVLAQDGYCFYADEDAIGPLWKVLRALTRLADATAAAIERVGLDEAPWAPNFSLT